MYAANVCLGFGLSETISIKFRLVSSWKRAVTPNLPWVGDTLTAASTFDDLADSLNSTLYVATGQYMCLTRFNVVSVHAVLVHSPAFLV